jgi:hypothetical protein
MILAPESRAISQFLATKNDCPAGVAGRLIPRTSNTGATKAEIEAWANPGADLAFCIVDIMYCIVDIISFMRLGLGAILVAIGGYL